MKSNPSKSPLTTEIADREQIELALRNGQQRFDLAMKSAGMGVWDWDIARDRIVWDEVVAAIFGAMPLENHDSVDDVFRNRLHPDDQVRVLRHHQHVLAGATDYSIQYRVRRPDDSVRWIISRGKMHRDASGKPVRVVGTILDITELKLESEAEHRRLKHGLREQKALLMIKEMETAPVEAMFRLTTELCGQILGVERSSVWLLNATETVIVCQDLYVLSHGAHEQGGELAAVSYPSYFQAITILRPVLAVDAEQHPATREFADSYLRPLGIGSMLDVPLHLAGRLIGVICFEHVGPCREWTNDEVRFAQAVASHVMLGLETARRRDAERELRESEARLRAISDNLPDSATFQLVLTASGDARFSYLSEGVDRLTGVSAAQGLADTHCLSRCLIPDDVPRIRQAAEESARTQGIFDLTVRVHTTTSVRKWLHVRAAPRRLENGETVWDGIALDITKRHRAEEELRTLWRSVEQSPAAVVITDVGGTIEYVNPRFLEVTGYTVDEAVGRNSRILKSGVHDAELYQSMWQALLSGDDWHGELCNRKKNGELYWESVAIAPVRNREDKITHFVAITEDISDRKRADELIKLYDFMVNSITDPISMISREYAYLAVNDAWCRIFQRERDRVLGRSIASVWGAEAFNRDIKGHFDRCFAGAVVSYQVWLEWDERGQKHFSISLYPYSSEMGRITHAIVVTRDTTIEKQAADDIVRARQGAEAANRAKSSFLANISHEIRTPMNAILGYSQLLLRDSSLSPQGRENLNIINRSGEHLLGLIDNVLEMAKIEAGRVTVESSAFDLLATLADVESMFRLKLEAKGLGFDVIHMSPIPPCVVGDEGKIRQVLMNLFGNAVKFTERGRITMRVSVNAATNPPWLVVEVEDSGPGISVNEIDKLFRHFEQTESGRASHKGTGLGLAISREYARLMGGDITVVSNIGQGSIFRFEIPIQMGQIKLVADKNKRRQVYRLKSEQSPVRILVADDNQVNRRLLSKLLTEVGFHVSEAVDGEQAIELWRTHKPQLILLDLRMPIRDGWETTRAIKADPAGKSTIVIIVTASVFEDDRQRVLAAGADDFIGKPCKEEELFAKISKHLGVEFLYVDAAPGAGTQSGSFPPCPTPESLTTVSAELIAGMRAAVQAGDMDRLNGFIQQVAAQDESLASFLRRYADEYDYDALSKFLT